MRNYYPLVSNSGNKYTVSRCAMLCCSLFLWQCFVEWCRKIIFQLLQITLPVFAKPVKGHGGKFLGDNCISICLQLRSIKYWVHQAAPSFLPSARQSVQPLPAFNPLGCNTKSYTAQADNGMSLIMLKRSLGLDICTWKGFRFFKSYAWASIVSANLLTLARKQLA